ncbi:MAG: protein translocase subunit SecF [Acidobacteria bacterium]|nr:protein translocase subunit SecF [Acidobacteriota bacterium]
MIEIFKNANYDFLSKKMFFIGLSWVLIAAGLVSVISRARSGKSLNMGVDFVGGTMANVKFKQTPDLNRLRAALEKQGIDGSQITLQQVGEQIGQPPKNEVLIRLPKDASGEADKGKQQVLAALATFNDASGQNKTDINTAGKDLLRDQFASLLGVDSTKADELATRIADFREKERGGLIANFDDLKNLNGIDGATFDKLSQNFFSGAASLKQAEAVSPQVGADLRNRAIYVTIVACLGMLIYVAFRFKSWGFGVGAIIAVVHDVLVTLGIFSIMQWEINLTVIAALLTLVGYSMNDTIVIFDRIRETMRTKRREPLEKLANDAINQTLSRTIITSGLTFLTVLAMLFFGGEVLKSFSWALVIGILIGTYSSIYIASPFMLWWENWRANANNGTAETAAVKIGAGDADAPNRIAPAGVTPQTLAAAGISIAPRKGSKAAK